LPSLYQAKTPAVTAVGGKPVRLVPAGHSPRHEVVTAGLSPHVRFTDVR